MEPATAFANAAVTDRPRAAADPSTGAPDRKPFVGGLAPWQVKRIQAHVETHLDARLRLEDLAALVRMSSSHFSRVFRKTFGQPVSRYVMDVRLERARRLLAGADRPISDIALACGLADQSHLTRAFHRRYGVPPGAWRRAHRRSGATGDPAYSLV